MADAATPIVPPGARVALVHDWLTGMRGGEKVLEVLCELLPEADIYTLLHVPGAVSETIARDRITAAGRIQRLPAAPRTYRWALPLMPGAIESFDLQRYDLVLSSSHCVAKSARPAPGALSVCYCHTPMRYMWDRFDDYFAGRPWPVRALIGSQRARLQEWDRRTAARVQHWVANSTEVRRRLHRFYGLPEAAIAVIAPPVDAERFACEPAPVAGLEPGSYDLVLSALVPYKRVDLAVEGAIAAGRHLVVAGRGGEREALEALAARASGPGRVTFLGPVADADVPGLYVHARCFVFPGLEDFGITPLEATAAGTPVVAYGAGGALDTVREGLNGIFFAEQTVVAVADALQDRRLDGPWDREAMRAHAARFGRDRFARQIGAHLAVLWDAHRVGEGDHV
jgi:glycosyltransferase involved in cell wall biosynthesis